MPLICETAEEFDELIQSIGPSSLHVAIRERMSSRLLSQMDPEDILQEAMAQAWRDRHRSSWKDVRAFRRWFLAIAQNRIHDAVERARAEKRGADRTLNSLESMALLSSLGLESSTPSRVAMRREKALLMQRALELLPGEAREVVRLRLFEDHTLESVASRLEISVATAKYRIRKAIEAYHSQLRMLSCQDSSWEVKN